MLHFDFVNSWFHPLTFKVTGVFFLTKTKIDVLIYQFFGLDKTFKFMDIVKLIVRLYFTKKTQKPLKLTMH